MADRAAAPFAFIVGAPRSGTTTLASLLKQNPEVCFSSVKEPHYFARHDLDGLDDGELRAQIDHDYLARFFDHCSGDEKLRAEGSVTYLYVPEKMAPILKLWPDAKFIIALRDPIDMLPSLHARLLITGDEDVADFPAAWAKIPERREGRSIPRSAMDQRWLRYDEAGALGTHVERFFAAVGRERCHVVLFDDLVADPQASYRDLCDFLGITPFPGTEFGARRSNMAYRFGWLQRLLKRPPKAVRTVLAGEQFRQREKSLDAREGKAIAAIFRVRRRLLAWNKVPAERQPLDPTLRDQIVDRLRGEVIGLSRLLGRDLSHWLGGIADAAVPETKSQRA